MTDTEPGTAPPGITDPPNGVHGAGEAGPSPADDVGARDDGQGPTGASDFVDPVTRTTRWAGTVLRRARAEPWAAVEALVSVAVVVAATLFVIRSTHPGLVLRNTTPTGGDMGAHVWGPMYLLQHLLPSGRLSGWTPDWYNGFPAYQFYMVVPSLFIVAVHVGIRGLLVVPAALGALALAVSGWCSPQLYRYRKQLLVGGLVLGGLVIPVPYNIAFKLVTIVGLVTLPAAAWAFGKLADLPFPVPPLLTLAALLFLYNRQPEFNGYGNIIGGNMSSTMAGEFAFSISLTFAVLYLGVAVRGLRTGRYRALAASLFALAGLCHLIPAFFVLACTAVLFVLQPDRARLKWLATMVPVAGLLTAFWVVPFVWQRDYVNDMGWEKLPVFNSHKGIGFYLLPRDLLWALVLAGFGFVISIVHRHIAGMTLGIVALLDMAAFVLLPEARLWNARLLPFLYLCVFFLAAIAVGEVLRSLAALAARDPARPPRSPVVVALAIVSCAVFGFVGLPLDGVLPGQTRGADGRAHLLGLSTRSSNPVSSWARWNYEGLEGKVPTGTSGGYPEYHDVVDTMRRIGQDSRHGCGRAFWEYSNRLEGYGTPMALMLLPYWTDGCIGSQEGLYFEASATTPYHFLMQAELSLQGSNPQRNLPYPSLDVDSGVRHMQMLGIKYYLASTPQAVAAAQRNTTLTEIASTGPWHVFEVADAPLVTGLRYEPVVWDDLGNGQLEWLDPSIAWFLDPTRADVPYASSGPKEWKRATFDGVPRDQRRLVAYVRTQLGKTGAMDQLPAVEREALPPVRVTGVRTSDDGIVFDVDRVGVPVLVRVSYFPNWEVTGADGPYRVTPNLMVVVPREKHVTMHFGRAPVDVASIGMTGLGVLGAVTLWRLPPVEMPRPRTPAHGRRRRAVATGPGPADAPAGPDDPADPSTAPPTGAPEVPVGTSGAPPQAGPGDPWA